MITLKINEIATFNENISVNISTDIIFNNIIYAY